MAKQKIQGEAKEVLTPGTPIRKDSSSWTDLYSFRTQAVILALLGLVFYWNTFSHEAAFDDRMAITGNEYVQQGASGIGDILTKDAYQSYLEQKGGGNQLAGGRYRPLSLVTFAIEQELMGAAPDGETANDKELRIPQQMHSRHVVNVLLYMLSVIVLLLFLRKVVFVQDPMIAFITALLFTIHPIHTEVVANVKSRDEILSVLFISLTFIKAHSYAAGKKMKDLVLALLCFFLALLSKEYAVTLIVLLPLSFYLFRKESLAASLKAMLVYLVPFGLYMALRMNAMTGAPEGAEQEVLNNPYLYATGVQKIATEIMVLLRYLQLLVAPVTLAADYSYNQIPYLDLSNAMVWLSVVVHVVAVAAMCVLLAKRHVLGFAIAIYLGCLVLISNIFFNIGAPMGERLVYHSSIGFCMLLAYVLWKGIGSLKQPLSGQIVAGVLVVIIALSGYRTIARNSAWKNDATLFLTDVQTVPNSTLANNNAAAACMASAKQAQDKPTRDEWFRKAIGYFDKAIAIHPKHSNARVNRGLCYYNMGHPELALPDWDSVRRYAPEQQNLSKYLGIAAKYFYAQGMRCVQTGKADSAVVYLKQGTVAAPEAAEMWYALGMAYNNANMKTEAMSVLERALKMAPNYTDAQRLYEQVKLK